MCNFGKYWQAEDLLDMKDDSENTPLNENIEPNYESVVVHEE